MITDRNCDKPDEREKRKKAQKASFSGEGTVLVRKVGATSPGGTLRFTTTMLNPRKYTSASKIYK